MNEKTIVLVVDDEKVVRDGCSRILDGKGYEVLTAENGRLAIEALLRQPYDLVLMDCEMPEMDGFTATREIRKLEDEGLMADGGRGRLPVVALTAHAVQGDIERCLEAGMDDYLSKPINPAELFSTIYFVRGHL